MTNVKIASASLHLQKTWMHQCVCSCQACTNSLNDSWGVAQSYISLRMDHWFDAKSFSTHTYTHTPQIQPLKALYSQGFLSCAHGVISPMQLRCFKSAFSGRRSMGVMRESAGWTALPLSAMGSPHHSPRAWPDAEMEEENEEKGNGSITRGKKCVHVI